MGIDFILDLVIDQVGEEQAKNIKNQLLILADKMSSDKIYILKKLGSKGVCLIMTDSSNCKVNFPSGEYTPEIIELESILNKVEV